MEQLKLYKLKLLQKLWIIYQKNLSDLNRREESLQWLDLPKMLEEEEKLKRVVEDKQNKF